MTKRNNKSDLIIEKTLSARAIKNRQSAQASRERHRRYVAGLEASRDALLLQSTDLQLRLAQLEVEKCRMGVELERMRRDMLLLKGKLGIVDDDESENQPAASEDMIDLTAVPPVLEASSAAIPAITGCSDFSLPSTETPVVSGYLLGEALQPLPLQQIMPIARMKAAVIPRRPRHAQAFLNGVSQNNFVRLNSHRRWHCRVRVAAPYRLTWNSLLNPGQPLIAATAASLMTRLKGFGNRKARR